MDRVVGLIYPNYKLFKLEEIDAYISLFLANRVSPKLKVAN